MYAILPGGTYNLLRAATSHPDAPPEDRVQFKAIVLRQPPDGTTHPDGSLRYDVLQEAGFQYMNLAALPPLEALDEESFGGGVVNSETVTNVLDVRAWVAQGGAPDRRWRHVGRRMGRSVFVWYRECHG